MADSESTEKRSTALDYVSALDDEGFGAFIREVTTGDSESPERLAAKIPRA